MKRFFAEIMSRRIRRGSYSSINDLEAAIHDYLAQHNETPKPFRWTKTAEDRWAKTPEDILNPGTPRTRRAG